MRINRLFHACYFLLAIGYSLLAIPCFAQEIKLTAWVDKQIITTEETVLFIVTVSGAQDTNQPQLPQLEGLALAFGPSISDETQIVNNNVSISRTFTYVLTPKAPGKYTIGPIRLDYKNKTYTTEPVQIEVVSSTGSSKKGTETDLEKSIFIEISTDKKEAYIYEQIVLTFKLYCQRGFPVDNLQYIPPATKNFLLEKLGAQREYEEVRDGVVYHVVELNTALFPVAAGELPVPPATIKCNVLLRSKQRSQSYDPFFDDFFGTTRHKFPVERQTEPITLTIKPLPEEGKPSDFNGAIGSYNMEVSSRSTNVNVGDPITLTIKISGEGYVHAIGEPSMSNTEGFKVYPAESRADITERKTPDLIRGWKEFSKVIEPLKAGIKETPTINFSFFDPVTAQYKTITSSPIPITVEAAEERMPIQLTLADDDKPKEQARVLKKDILPLMTNLSALTNQGDLLYKNPILLGFLTLPLISIIASVIIQQRTEKFKTDSSYARKKRAFVRAKMQLMAADHLTTQPEFYSIISKALCEYIADKLNAPVASITSHNLPVKLEQYDLSPEIIGELTHCLDTCEHGRFSNEKRPEQELQEVLKSAEKLIKQMERKI